MVKNNQKNMHKILVTDGAFSTNAGLERIGVVGPVRLSLRDR